MWFFKKTDKKRENRKKSKDPLKTGALKELKKLKSKRFSDISIENLNKIFGIYLKEKYKIKQSLTYEEISKKIQKKFKKN